MRPVRRGRRAIGAMRAGRQRPAFRSRSRQRQGVVSEREREHVRRQAASPVRRQQDPDARSERSTRTVTCSALPPSSSLDGPLRRRCRQGDACGCPALNENVLGFSFGCHVVWMIRHCCPVHLNQPLKRQFRVGNQAGGSDESFEHRDSVTREPNRVRQCLTDWLEGSWPCPGSDGSGPRNGQSAPPARQRPRPARRTFAESSRPEDISGAGMKDVA